MRKVLRYILLIGSILLLLKLCLGAIIICAALTGLAEWKKRRTLREKVVQVCNAILAHPTSEAAGQLTKLIEKNGLFALPVYWNTIRLIWAFVYASPEVSEERKMPFWSSCIEETEGRFWRSVRGKRHFSSYFQKSLSHLQNGFKKGLL